MSIEDSKRRLFRDEAVAYQRRREVDGDILRLSPSWARRSYWVLVLVLASTLGFAVLGTVNEYATGPCLVRIDPKVELTSVRAATVRSVEVLPGQRVAAGEILVRLDDAEEMADLARVNKEQELTLVRLLRDPTDKTATERLVVLHAQREQAVARSDERLVRAPSDGVVTDVRIRPRQHLDAGDPVLALVGASPTVSIVALLPAHERPLVRPGMPLRLELAGFPYAYQDLTIEGVGDEVVGPEEVRRYFGPDLADTVPPHGPVVLLRAKLLSGSFVANDRVLDYYDGMQGQVEVRVRAERVLVALLPGLRWL